MTGSSFVFLLMGDYKRGCDGRGAVIRVLERKVDTPRKWAGGKPASSWRLLAYAKLTMRQTEMFGEANKRA